jgi:regulatory protein
MKKVTPNEAKGKIQRYCAYQERCHQEVKNKLYEYGLYSTEVDQLLSELITDGFLNEERYAKAFAGGKFRMKKWGRIKITHALEAHGLSKNCIRIGLKEIDEENYLITLNKLLERKSEGVESENVFEKRDKLSKYAIQKGFEPDLVWQALKKLLPDHR